MIDNVNHPNHYTTGFALRPLECIDLTKHLPFSLGNAVKYVWRSGKKGSDAKAVEDLEKAVWYIDLWDCNPEIARPGNGFATAREIFALVVPEVTNRYAAVKALLECRTEDARELIDRMKREVRQVAEGEDV